MAITTIDGVIAGAQYPRFFVKGPLTSVVVGRPHSTWGIAGIPGAGSYDTTLNGVILTAPIDGQIPFTNPSSGNTYLTRLVAQAANAGVVLLCDRLWHNGGFTITSTGAQSIASPAWPARDLDGATAGNGVLLALEISAAAGAAAPTITISYTNSNGTAGRSGTNIEATANSPVAGAAYRISLQAGDVGVKSVESLTLNTSWLSGTMNLVAYRILGMIETVSNSGSAYSSDLLNGGFPRMYNGSVPYFMRIPFTTDTSRVSGVATWTQG